MATLTRATLGKLTQLKTKTIVIGDDEAIIKRPSPLEKSRYTMSLIGDGFTDPKNIKPDMRHYHESVMRLVAAMWVDADGNRIFGSDEWKELDGIDPDFYEQLSDECLAYSGTAAIKPGESDSTTALDSPAESA
jgi:hypothetical protein